MTRSPSLVAWLACAALAVCAIACEQRPPGRPDPGITAPDPRDASPDNLLGAENARTGTHAWWVPEEQRASAKDLAVWASPYSLLQGDTLDVFVRAHGDVAVFVYRLGWYGGDGGREVFHRDSVHTHAQPACRGPQHSPVTCNWAVTLRVPSSAAWTTGLYLLKVVDSSGKAYLYPFVVRDGRVAQFIAVVPQFTWQAYNNFGGGGLYASHWTPYASFERPYAANGGASYMYQGSYSGDLSVARWLERQGYDVTYVSDADLALAPRFRAPLKGLLFLGHSEYWTTREYDRVEAMRNQGTHLAFFAGNNAYWNVRAEHGPVTGRAGHLVICYKSSYSNEHDPAGEHNVDNATVRFRDDPINRPENGLYGVMYERFVLGNHSLVAPAQLAPEAKSFLAAAGLGPRDSLPSVIPSAEGDQIVINGHSPVGLQTIFVMPYPSHRVYDTDVGWFTVPAGAFHTTFFRAASGAGVFAAGNNEWAGLLDDTYGPAEPHLQAISKAVLDWMLAH